MDIIKTSIKKKNFALNEIQNREKKEMMMTSIRSSCVDEKSTLFYVYLIELGVFFIFVYIIQTFLCQNRKQ
jgi:hypothetical protein